MTYKTDQEGFWAGEFGREYVSRNQGENFIRNNVALFARILRSAPGVKSIVELGCNIGLNLMALKRIGNDLDLVGYELNETAARRAAETGVARIVCDTVMNEIKERHTFDLAFTSGLLIHIEPKHLDAVYQNLFKLSHKYILVSEYYNPTPVMVEYRGLQDRLFKRDFAGELIDKFNLRLIDYGFVYHRDRSFPQDDATWFLLEK